jgi:putative hemolysin
MKLDAARFEVRLARTGDDLAAAQRLRYKVFVEEMGATATPAERAARLETDDFDEGFDHLLLIDTDPAIADPLERVAGVYRLLPGARALAGRGFYSASEYDLSPLADRAAHAVELGRSCVGAAYRGGIGMHLLWQGLAGYVLDRGLGIMFGVASFPGTDAAAIAPALRYLHDHHLAPADLRARAIGPDRVEMGAPGTPADEATAMRMTPNLIKAYLRLGGFVGDGAFIDRDFNTIDVMVVMDTARMTARYRDFYTRLSRSAAGTPDTA